MEAPFAAYQGDQPCIFVCYAHEDSDVVYPEMAWLNEQGLNVWYDEGISAGKNWRAVIGDSLLGASHVLLYISERSLKSDHCNREINLALDERKNVVPVYLEDVELTSDLKVGLNRVQALYRDKDANYQQRLLGALGKTTDSAQPMPPATQKQEKPAVLSIAVLPFVNMSSDPEQTYFSDGITEDLIDTMVKSLKLKVIGQSSSFQFKDHSTGLPDVAARLGVTHLVQGSVRKSGDKVRINAQLIRASDGVTEWSDHYTRKLVDVFAVQDEITAEIASALRTILLGSARSVKVPPQAHEEYLRGKACLRRFSTGDAEDALQHFESAIEHAPGFPEAYGQAAHAALSQQGSNAAMAGQTRIALLDRASVLSDKALALDRAQADALASKARFLYQRQWRHAEALDLLQKTLARYPGHSTVLYVASHALASIGHWDALLRITNLWKDVDPLSAEARFWGAMAGFSRGDDVAPYIEEVESGLAIQPGNNLLVGMLGHLLLEGGLIDQARRLATDFPKNLVTMYVNIALGDASAMQEWIRKAPSVEGSYPYQLMYLHWWLGEEDTAKEYLAAALDTRHPHIINWHSMWRYATCNNDRQFGDFVEDPECQAILAHTGQDQGSLQALRDTWPAT